MGNEKAPPPGPLGFFFFREPDSSIWVNGIGVFLTPGERGVMRVRHLGDLLSYFPGWYHYDLATAGREITLSPGGAGIDGSRLIWRRRLYRDPFTFRPVPHFISPSQVATLLTMSGGSYQGTPSGTGLIVLEPVRSPYTQPLTSLFYQDGFYGFEPVEFVHARKLNPTLNLTLGGFFPAWSGRLPNTRYQGRSLWGEVFQRWGTKSEVSISFQDGLHRTQIPFPLKERLNRRWDGDGEIIWRWGAHRWSLLHFYTSQTIFKESPLREWGRESGVVFFHQHLPFLALSGRFTRLNGTLGSNIQFTDWEGEGGVTLRKEGKGSGWWMQGGGERSLEGGVRGLGLIGGWLWIPPIGRFSTILSSQPMGASPRQLWGYYPPQLRPVDISEVLWDIFPTATIKGGKVSSSRLQSLQVKWLRGWRLGEGSLQLFYWDHHRPFIWKLERDTVIVPNHLNRRAGWGVDLGWRGFFRNWRIRGEAIKLWLDQDPPTRYPPTLPEPTFRAWGEVGWRRSFFEGTLEVDGLMRGWYYASVEYPLEERKKLGEEWKKLGGGYPLEFRVTARLMRFNLYYGVFNWNSYPFSLVPGYPIMHKEEYWGVEWTLVD